MSRLNRVTFTFILLFQVLFALGQDHKINYEKDSIESWQNFNNLFKVNDSLYRSEQPSKNGMLELQNHGIVTVLNLRNTRNDRQKLANTNLIGVHVPINTWKISYNDILESLKVYQISNKPVLVHCLHGSDRTGTVIASYRMVYENWSKEKAIAEFTSKKYGYHKKWFPGILALLESLDIESLRSDLKLPKIEPRQAK